VVTR